MLTSRSMPVAHENLWTVLQVTRASGHKLLRAVAQGQTFHRSQLESRSLVLILLSLSLLMRTGTF